MSEHLGPIHYLMYERIKYQDILTGKLLEDQPKVLSRLNHIMPPVPRKSLETLIDQPNLHGWLSARIDMVETRYAYALRHAENAMEKLREAGREKGTEAGDFETLHKDLMPYLLDGMPCDGALLAQYDKGEDALYLTEEKDTHAAYAEKLLDFDPMDSLSKTCDGNHDHDDHHNFHLKMPEKVILAHGGGKADLYHLARLAWLEGFLEKTPFKAELIGGKSFRVSRKV